MIKSACFLFVIIIIFINDCYADDNLSKKIPSEDVIGVSFVNSYYENKENAGYIELRWQSSDRLMGSSIIPFNEFNLSIGLSDKNPTFYLTELYGFKRKILGDSEGLILSSDFGIGIVVGGGNEKKGYTSFIGKMGFDIVYRNVVLRYGASILSGFPQKGNIFLGISYVF